MWQKLLGTSDDSALAVLRIVLGGVILAHGAQKLLGWFGGPGLGGTLAYFGEVLAIPAFLAILVVFFEFFGALALVIGLLGRIAALGISAIMLGAILKVHLASGFFMNWTGTQSGEGFEYHLLALGIAAAVIAKGSGAASVDRWLISERAV